VSAGRQSGADGRTVSCVRPVLDLADVTATVVLVHGAWHGAWCWDGIVAGLEARAIPAVAVDLPGHGLDAGPMTDLHGDADRVRSVLDACDGPVVLVGHSYGGGVITEAGGHPQVAHLVYVAAFPLDESESAASAATEHPRLAELVHDGRPDLGSALAFAEDGTTTLIPEGAARLLYNRCSPDVAAAAVLRLDPQPMVNLTQSPTTVAWRERPSTYAVCADDNIVHPGLQRILAERASTVVEWDTDHSPFLSRPDLVVDLLADLAAQL